MRAETARWVPARVEIHDFAGPYDAEILDGETWNGWVIPRFTREVAELLMADVNAATPSDIADERETLQWSPNGRAIQMIRTMWDAAGDDGVPETSVETIEPDADGRYAIGARAWIWEHA